MLEPKAPINSYRDLVVWQEAMNLAEAAYRLTRQFPKDEADRPTSAIRGLDTSQHCRRVWAREHGSLYTAPAHCSGIAERVRNPSAPRRAHRYRRQGRVCALACQVRDDR